MYLFPVSKEYLYSSWKPDQMIKYTKNAYYLGKRKAAVKAT